MRDNKAFASLSSGLLARKGQARPAMRPQGFGLGQGNPEDLGWNDMGYDQPRSTTTTRLPSDLSGAPTRKIVDPLPPLVRQQQEELAREFEAVEEEGVVEAAVSDASEPVAEIATRKIQPIKAAPRSRAKAAKTVSISPARPAGRKAAFTLRLDADRHLRLRLACAVQNRSAQQFVTEALDGFLAQLPDVERLAASIPGGLDAAHSAGEQK